MLRILFRELCILPPIEGNLYYINSNPVTVLSHGSHVNNFITVFVTCQEGYYKSTTLNLTMVCLRDGEWSTTYTKLCLSKRNYLN